jgi:hypothetical protein
MTHDFAEWADELDRLCDAREDAEVGEASSDAWAEIAGWMCVYVEEMAPENMRGKIVANALRRLAQLEGEHGRTLSASAQKERHLSDDTTDTDRQRPA